MYDPAVRLQKAPTGISGFDAITFGGLPAGRPTLICGGAGCGKTLFAVTFLVNGAMAFDEPGVFMSFEERAGDLSANVASLGYDLDRLVADRKLVIDYVRVDRSGIEENGDYDLEGLFVRLGFAVDSIGAKRVVLDTVETLFSGFTNPALLRAELRRLLYWIKDRGLTAIVTGEAGEGGELTRQGLQEYVSDCVIVLDNRVRDQITTRRLRVMKYRGSAHGGNEYPFLIDREGISVLPAASSRLNERVSNEVISTGVSGLDAMLQKSGFYRGSSILLSGSAGTGKTTFGSHFIDAACSRGERCLFFAFEESAEEICRNGLAAGLDLQRQVDRGLLRLYAARPGFHGLEMHLARMHRDLDQFSAHVVVVDAISAFRGPSIELHLTLLRMMDLLKSRGITALFTSLQSEGPLLESADQGLLSLMDVWVSLTNAEAGGKRHRVLRVVKARGMSHSDQVREYHMTSAGVVLVDACIGGEDDLAGNARPAQEAREQAAAVIRLQDIEQRRSGLARHRATMRRQITELRAAIRGVEDATVLLIQDDMREAVHSSLHRPNTATVVVA